MEIFGFKGFCSPYGMQKTGTKLPYGFKELAGNPVRCVCVYWWGKSQCGEVRRKAKSDQFHVLEGQDDFVLKYGREIGKKMMHAHMGKPGNVHTVRC